MKKISKETQKLILISVFIVMAGLFLIHGEEMAAITMGSSGTLSVFQYENISVSYNVGGYLNSQSCVIDLYSMPINDYDKEVLVGSFTHYNAKSSDRMTGTFKEFNFSERGEYLLTLESTFSDGFSNNTKVRVIVSQGGSGNNSTPTNQTNNSSGTNGSSGGSGNTSGGNSGIEIIQNNSNGSSTSPEIIPGGNSSGNGQGNNSGGGSNSNQTGNSSSGNDSNGNSNNNQTNTDGVGDPVVELPESLLEFFETILKNLWRVLTGQVSLIDIFKAWWEAVKDILENGFSWEALLRLLYYALMLLIVVAVAVLVVYIILKVAVRRTINKLSE